MFLRPPKSKSTFGDLTSNSSSKHSNSRIPKISSSTTTSETQTDAPLLVKIDWKSLAQTADWSKLSINPDIHILTERIPEKIDWRQLAVDPNVHLWIERNPEKIDWRQLAVDPNVHLWIERNPEKIDWSALAQRKATPILDGAIAISSALAVAGIAYMALTGK